MLMRGLKAPLPSITRLGRHSFVTPSADSSRQGASSPQLHCPWKGCSMHVVVKVSQPCEPSAQPRFGSAVGAGVAGGVGAAVAPGVGTGDPIHEVVEEGSSMKPSLHMQLNGSG